MMIPKQQMYSHQTQFRQSDLDHQDHIEVGHIFATKSKNPASMHVCKTHYEPQDSYKSYVSDLRTRKMKMYFWLFGFVYSLHSEQMKNKNMKKKWEKTKKCTNYKDKFETNITRNKNWYLLHSMKSDPENEFILLSFFIWPI